MVSERSTKCFRISVSLLLFRHGFLRRIQGGRGKERQSRERERERARKSAPLNMRVRVKVRERGSESERASKRAKERAREGERLAFLATRLELRKKESARHMQVSFAGTHSNTQRTLYTYMCCLYVCTYLYTRVC